MFCRGDVMSRFMIIIECWKETGTGGARRRRFFPLSRSASGSDPRTTRGKVQPLVLGQGISYVCTSYVQYLLVCLPFFFTGPIRKTMSEKETKSAKQARCREEDSTMSPQSDDSDPYSLCYFRLNPLDVFCAGNINHNSRSDPTQLCTAFVDVAEGPAEHTAGCPISFSQPANKAGYAGTNFPQRTM